MYKCLISIIDLDLKKVEKECAKYEFQKSTPISFVYSDR